MRRSRRFLDIQYRTHTDGEQLLTCNFPVFINRDDNITIKGAAFNCTDELWELLTPTDVNTLVVNKADLETHNKLLKMSNAHSNTYVPVYSIHMTRRKNFPMSLRALRETEGTGCRIIVPE